MLEDILAALGLGQTIACLTAELADMTAERDSESRWACQYKAERDVLRTQLDAVAGLLTGQPGADPTPQDEGWSPALAAAQEVLRERNDYRLSVLSEIKGHAEAVNERDEARASERKKVRELRDLLRKCVIHNAPGNASWCSECNRNWLKSEPEECHAFDCLAALRDGAGREG